MSINWNELTDQYKSALVDYLDQPDERALERAWELGRQVVASDLGILELATVHREVLENVLAPTMPPECRRRLHQADDFLRECLSPFEMVHRGVKEANVTLGRMH